MEGVVTLVQARYLNHWVASKLNVAPLGCRNSRVAFKVQISFCRPWSQAQLNCGWQTVGYSIACVLVLRCGSETAMHSRATGPRLAKAILSVPVASASPDPCTTTSSLPCIALENEPRDDGFFGEQPAVRVIDCHRGHLGNSLRRAQSTCLPSFQSADHVRRSDQHPRPVKNRSRQNSDLSAPRPLFHALAFHLELEDAEVIVDCTDGRGRW